MNEPAVVPITVWDNDDPYKYFEVEGTAELDEREPASTSTSSRCATRGKPFHTPTDRVIVRVNPTRVLDHGIED